MLAGGLWERAPRPEVVLSQHVGPLPAGMYVMRPENMMNLGDTLTVTVRGRQAHGSQPETSIDPIVAAAAMVLRLQTISSREVSPTSGVVVTVGRIRGGTAPNIIPDTCEFTVNVRTPDEATRDTVMSAVHRILKAEADASRATVTTAANSSFPRCFNDPEQTARVRAAFTDAWGDAAVMSLPHPVSASEDAGALADSIEVPLVYWMFGGFPPEAFADGVPPGNHSPHFAPHGPSALRTGIAGAVTALGVYLGRSGFRATG
jgi:hippurate hydrolase